MPLVLTINDGSSSIRFAFYEVATVPSKRVVGKLDRIGMPDASLTAQDVASGAPPTQLAVPGGDHGSAAVFLMRWISEHPDFGSVVAVGHRIVHGMTHSAPERVTSRLLAELHGIVPFDPEHLPREIELVELLRERHPHLPQVVCFDTAFHRGMPRVASVLPIPRRFESRGVRRYGFHGLSYTFLLAELVRLGDAAATGGRVVLAHLGNGASLAAVRDGACIDTSMAFTPAAGLVMSTRSGDLDPGLMSFLATSENMSGAAFDKMVNHESGLLGISETSSDIRDLLASESSDPRAAEAVDIFCYQVKKWIGAYAAALGGIDTLVFAGGIGENAPQIRARICAGLEFLGIELDAAANARGDALISSHTFPVSVRVMHTDEESVIATAAIRALGLVTTKDSNP